MNRILLFVTIILLCFTTNSFGETTTESDASVDFEYIINSSDTYNSKVIDSPNLIQAGKVDGASVSIPGAYRNRAKIESILPKFFGDFEFNVLANTAWNKYGMDIIEIQNVANWWWSNNALETGHSPLQRSSDTIFPLPYIPEGPNVKPVSYCYIKIEDHDEMPLRTMYEGIEKAWIAGGKAKYFTLMYKITPTNRGEVSALGTAAVTSAAHAGSNMPGKEVSSGAFGAGFGSAEAFVWDSGYFFIAFWNKDQEKNEKPEIAQKAKIKTKKIEVKEVIPEITENVFFAFDSYKINTEKQLAVIAKNTKILAEVIKRLKKDEKIYVVGCTSDEGTEPYNIVLGEDRAHTAAKLYGKGLKAKGFSTKIIKDKIRYVSMGKIAPGYKKREKNRRTYLIIAKPI